MESFKIENLSFCYPGRDKKALDSISITINQGDFVTICGKSGCGKTTLLRLLKTALSPFGSLSGSISFEGAPLSSYDAAAQASRIGFVMQNPDNQIVTDKVWHELAFGMESLGFSTPEIRARVSEMASFFGIESWFYKNVTELSGGQKQLLNLASVMAVSPSVLILDEPTSQLDPIAAQEFLKALEKINQELGTTIILTEHRLEDAFPISDRVIVMDNGKIIADDTPRKAGELLNSLSHDMYPVLPVPMRVHAAVESNLECPLTVREGRNWLEAFSKKIPLNPHIIPETPQRACGEPIIEVKDVWFRYEKSSPDVIKGLSLNAEKSEILAIVGGNGTGKTTALSLISGINKPYRGNILIKGRSIPKTPDLYGSVLGVLPQNPQSVFVKKTLWLDLMDILSDIKISPTEKTEKIHNISSLCHIEELLERHPYDLSGGEQQRAALAKVLLQNPEILLLDEPTKGMDAHFKEEFGDILKALSAGGVTIIMVSHDIEFCAKHADRCAMFFDGSVTSIGHPREFFAGKNFYTTAANRMARTRLKNAILAEDIILACGGKVKETERKKNITPIYKQKFESGDISDTKKLSLARIISGSIFAILFVLTSIASIADWDLPVSDFLQLFGIIEVTACVLSFFPGKDFGITEIRQPNSNRKLAKRTLLAAFLVFLAIPLTIYVGTYFFNSRKYYFISLLIILEAMIPFVMLFESRKPQARELVIISVLCAIAVASRSAFFMLPQFKPVVAIVIIAGVCLGGETGFLVGAVTGFVSNFFLGQGPWTPWQMAAFGIIGFLAGILFKKGIVRKNRGSLCIFGFAATLIIYGGILNPASIIMWQDKITPEMILVTYIKGLPFDVIHASSTAFFLWFIAETMIEKLERIKVKYGLLDGNK